MDKTAHKTAIVIRSGDALGHSLRRIRLEQSLTQSDIAQRANFQNLGYIGFGNRHQATAEKLC